jgi:hypothetical protein
MGSIVLQVNGTTIGNVADGAGLEIVRAVSETDSARLIAALGEYYSSSFAPQRNGEPAMEKTIENIITIWWDDVIRQAKKHVERYEAKTLTVPPIVVASSVEEIVAIEEAALAAATPIVEVPVGEFVANT